MEITIVQNTSSLETIAVIISLVSVLVLMAASVVAYFIQRSRFLKELQPDITIETIECKFRDEDNDDEKPRLVAELSLKNRGAHEIYIKSITGSLAVLPNSLTNVIAIERIASSWPADSGHRDKGFSRITSHLFRDVALVFEFTTPFEKFSEYRLQLDFDIELESGKQALLYLLFKSVVTRTYSLSVIPIPDMISEDVEVHFSWFR